MVNRCLKIFPAYWAAVIFCYVVYGSLGQEGLRFDILALLVTASLLLSYLPQGNNLLVISIAWAVVVEFQFYILAALTFALALRSRASGAVLAWIGVIILAAAAFVHLTQGFTRFYGAFQFGPYFVLGASLYYFVSRRDRRLVPLMAVSFLFSLYAFVSYNARGDLEGVSWALSASALLFVSGCFLMAWLVGERLQAPVEWLDKRFGDVTYAIYLVHPAVIAVVIAVDLDGGLAYLASFIGSLAVAVAIHRAIERPVMKVRNVLRGCRLYD